MVQWGAIGSRLNGIETELGNAKAERGRIMDHSREIDQRLSRIEGRLNP